MSKFENICYKMNSITHWLKSTIFTVVYALLLLSYIECIDGLQKPAGFMEALDFLFANPQDYIIALLVGVVLHMLPWLLGLSVMLALVAAFLYDEERKIALYVIDAVLTVVMFILNENMVHYVGALALVAACICLGFWAFVDSSKR